MAASICNSRFVGYQWIKVALDSNINPFANIHNRIIGVINNFIVSNPIISLGNRSSICNDLVRLTTDLRSWPVPTRKKIPLSSRDILNYSCQKRILLSTGFDREYGYTNNTNYCVAKQFRKDLNVNTVWPYTKTLGVCLASHRSDSSSLHWISYINSRSICTNCKRNQHKASRRFSHCDLIYRSYSDNVHPQKKKPMHLTDFPEIIWPSIIKSLRNWILANLIITPYFDREFNLPDFICGSKKALDYVSHCFSKNEFEKLQGLVAPETLQEVRQNVASFSVQQREELQINQEDIYFSFPYQVGVMFSDDDANQKRFVEITMCYHVLQGLDELRKVGTSPPINMGMMPEYRDKIHICNYRFIREFTKGVDGEWMINALNHFKPSDYIS